MKIAKCKLKDDVRSPAAVQFTLCILQFSICNSFSSSLLLLRPFHRDALVVVLDVLAVLLDDLFARAFGDGVAGARADLAPLLGRFFDRLTEIRLGRALARRAGGAGGRAALGRAAARLRGTALDLGDVAL